METFCESCKSLFIYAANRDSLCREQSLQVLERCLDAGLFIADLELIEFFRKISRGTWI